ncbi:hypothetical protein [Sphingobacterium athyrii]|uniref:Uncharacterized protein n=1 Tax=Sphingobacterium athyrii TaxID=2152717 RepID=A0A363NUI5_9SPHI|nr:hypothetical protein [Sphingobacterium athyrii]PUV24439.1 hypothetical protein DCO56_13925 [Sphingobacterium athyrii]
MKRRLPVIEIEGTPFYVNISRFALVEYGNPENEISFLHMKDCNTNYEFNYNPKTKNLSRGKENGEAEIPVKVPRLGVLDPQGMMESYNCTLEELKTRTDYGIIVDHNKKIHNRRVSGELPTIDLAGNIYEVLYEENSLRPKGWKGETISLYDYRQSYYDEDEQMFYLYYDTRKNKVVDPAREDSWDKIEDHIMVKVRDVAALDCIKSSEKEGNAYTGVIFCNVQLHHVAETIPLKKNDIEDMESRKLREEYEENRKDGLSTIKILGTNFIVDVVNYQLRERSNESNILYFRDWHEVKNGYGFYYDTKLKNIPKESFNPETTHYVEIPEFVKMAPLEVAETAHISLQKVLQMTDFEIMVNTYMFKERMAGNIPDLVFGSGSQQQYFVDLERGMLRPYYPKSVEPILFVDIQKYYDPNRDCYIIPYNTTTNALEDLDFVKTKEIPKNVGLFAFPSLKRMDPVGWNLLHGLDPRAGLKQLDLHVTFIAEKIGTLEISLKENTVQNARIVNKHEVNECNNNHLQTKKTNKSGRRLK